MYIKALLICITIFSSNSSWCAAPQQHPVASRPLAADALVQLSLGSPRSGSYTMSFVPPASVPTLGVAGKRAASLVFGKGGAGCGTVHPFK